MMNKIVKYVWDGVMLVMGIGFTALGGVQLAADIQKSKEIDKLQQKIENAVENTVEENKEEA